MVGKQVDVSVRQFLSIHLLNAVCEKTAVKAYETRLWELANKGCNIFMLYIRISVIL